MASNRQSLLTWQRSTLQLVIGMAGLVAIVGSGGGVSLPPDFVLLNPAHNVRPDRVTVQVGSDAVFEVVSSDSGPRTYQWCRTPAAGRICATIAGATSETYRVVGANLADDGASYTAIVTWPAGTSSSASGRLMVSSMPGVVYQDGEFAASDWEVTALLEPAQNGPTFTVALSATGGNPGAFRSVVYDFVAVAPSSVHVLHHAVKAIYDPSVQGAIYSIDFTEDCIGTPGGGFEPTVPLIRQSGRSYAAIPEHYRYCPSTSWYAVTVRSSLYAGDFELIDGPACLPGEPCARPDFSANAAPISLGLVSAAWQFSELPPGTTARFAHGFDNWKATVWRR